jgi:RNA polymerase sigma-70 factor (ECF subfamily)
LLRLKDRSDADAWRTFDTLYRPILYRFARRRGLAHADAEDVTQHCLTVISTHIGTFDYDPRRGRFKSWLRTLVNNRVHNLLRDRHERQGDTSVFEIAQQSAVSPEEAFDHTWLEEHLWHCLRELQAEIDPTTYRAFEAYVIEQKPLDEVCRELNLTANNVYTIKWRVTRKVAQRMRELTGESEGS